MIRKIPGCLIVCLLSTTLPLGAAWCAGTAYSGETRPASERALRDRVEQLYTALQQGDWAKAEEYLTSESKEIFRQESKQRLDGFEIKSITLDTSGQAAIVVVDLPFFFPGIPDAGPFQKVTRWRLVNGVWLAELPKPDSEGPRPPNPTVSTSQPLPTAVGSNDLKFESTTYNLGEVRTDQTTTARFAFKNTGADLVTVADVQMGCDCLKLVTPKREFRPGESGLLEFKLDPSGLHVSLREAFTQTILLKTEPGDRYVELTISAILVPGDPPNH